MRSRVCLHSGIDIGIDVNNDVGQGRVISVHCVLCKDKGESVSYSAVLSYLDHMYYFVFWFEQLHRCSPALISRIRVLLFFDD